MPKTVKPRQNSKRKEVETLKPSKRKKSDGSHSRPVLKTMLSPLLDQPSLFDFGFKVIRKRRATVQDVKSLSPTRKTPRRRSSGFLRTEKAPIDDPMSENDFVLQEDNLVSKPEEVKSFQALCEAPIVTDLIRRPSSHLPGNERRPSAMKRQRTEMDSPVSFRTKRCASLCLARRQERGLRERNRSVNDYNIPKVAPTQFEDLSVKSKLKTVSGKHSDLKYIEDDTLVQLLRGETPVTIVDARYPYEYKGGHIKSAINIYTADMLVKHFYDENKENQTSTQTIIFHCEFSSERAPALLRCLRRLDRAKNCYPQLDFPEIYLLKGGYKDFYAKRKSLTTGSYLPMLDDNYAKDLRHFRKKCKTAPSNKI